MTNTGIKIHSVPQYRQGQIIQQVSLKYTMFQLGSTYANEVEQKNFCFSKYNVLL